MKQFTAMLCLALLSLSSARSIPRPMLVAPENCNTTEFQAGLVLEEINKDREDGYIFSLLRVADAHSQQAGAGTIFYFTIDVLETNCPVVSRKSWKECDVGSFHQGVFGQCKAAMYLSLPWRSVHLYQYNCTLSSVPPPMILRMCPDCPIPARDLTAFVENAERMVVEFNKLNSQPHYFKLVKVERASTAWMIGPTSFVKFTIKETNCPSSTTNPADCHFLEKGKAHVGFCSGSEISQPGPVGDKVSVTCDIYDPKPVDPTTPDTKKEACDNGKTPHHCHVKADGETRTCKVEAYQKPGETTYTIESLNCDLPAAGAVQVLLPVACPGCPEHISGNSDEVQTILKQAIEKYNKESNQPDDFKVGEILKATSQVVAGFKYAIEFKIQQTNCSKSDAAHHPHDCKHGKDDEHHGKEPCTKTVDWNKCPAKAGEGVTHTCKVEYWTQPWTKTKKITSLDCNLPAGVSPAADSPINCPGCPSPIPGNSEKLQPILHEALEKYNKESNQAHLYKLGQIIKAASQVVSGTKYIIEFTIEETSCTAADLPTISADCKADGHHGHHEHGHGHSHEHGHGHGHEEGHQHHHHHKGHHGSSEDQTGSKPVAPPPAGPVGSVQYVHLAGATDVLPAPSISDQSHPVAQPAILPVQPGPHPFNPFAYPEPMPFPTNPSVSPSCPGEPKHSFPLILPLLPAPK